MQKISLRIRDFLAGHSIFIPVCLIGTASGLVIAWAMVFFYLTRDMSVYPAEQKADSHFRQELLNYDAALLGNRDSDPEKLLRRLEKRAGSAEERLSVLKRRRQLARENPHFLPGYRNAITNALKDFPHSQTVAALAVEAAFLYGNSEEPYFIPPQSYAAAEAHISGFAPGRFDALRLCFYVLSGIFEDPLKAASIPGIENLLSANITRLPVNVMSGLRVNQVLIRIINGDEQVSSVEINKLIADEPQNRDFLRLGAEYFFDYGSRRNSAALFARLGDIYSLSREADALALSGDVPAARNIWIALASPSEDALVMQSVSPEIRQRSLYNLAVSANDEKEARLWLERLFASFENPWNSSEESSPVEIFSLIRYTRLHDTQRSIAILQGAKHPLLDLELLQRKMDILPPELWTPQVWLLLGRHPDEEELYQWSAAFFDRQKLYRENAQLFNLAEKHQFTGGWILFHRGLALARAGKAEAGEKLLKEALAKKDISPWIVYANLGRISESMRSISAAIEYYEAAVANAGEGQASVQIWLCLSRCYEAMARIHDSRKALEYALELEPDNIFVRHKLGRMNTK
ncbi:MAG: hypothetical protein LBH43_02095 [Treponema sp.]|jgi:tetratricopeptide (TPR) repeat protein|nr:hypothetical protein [Treponema sp.]